MKQIFVYTITLVFCCVALLSTGQPAGLQDITGIWKGDFYVDSTKMTYPFELSISEDNGKYLGYSRLSFEEKGIRHVVIRDHTVVMEGNTFVIEDVKQLAKASTINQPKDVRKRMVVTVSQSDSLLSMAGTWKTNRTRFYLAATGTVTLTKEKDFRNSELYKKLDSLSMASTFSYVRKDREEKAAEVEANRERYLVKRVTKPATALERKTDGKKLMALAGTPVRIIKPRPMAIVQRSAPAASAPVVAAAAPKAPAAPSPAKQPVARRASNIVSDGSAATQFASRQTSTMQEVFFRSDSLQLTLYDNGEIDGDTVSVLMNGKVIIARQGLSTKTNVHTVYIDEETPDSIQLVMYAENLGSIPPNTGLLIVKDGNSTYEVRFSADLKTNAAIVLRRRR